MSQSHRQHPGNTLLFLLGFTLLATSFSAYSDSDQDTLNALWLEAGMKETPGYYESDRVAGELNVSVLKNYWLALVRGNEQDTPTVKSRFDTGPQGSDYGLHLSGNGIKFRFAYSF